MIGKGPVEELLAKTARNAAFGSAAEKLEAHKAAWHLAAEKGIYPASTEDLYRSFGRNENSKITVPAMNMRAIAYESARGVFQAMADKNVGAAIFELSRGEIGFTGQRPLEYATVILCAAITENHTGPLFLQGDHFQVSATRYRENPEQEMQDVQSLIREAIDAGFYNIDIDTSTLVDPTPNDLADQQALNIELTAELANFTRLHEPEGVTISLGGEIGEVGDENSTAEEVDVYLRGVTELMKPGYAGLSKLSIQSGTRHGGNVLADGSFGDMHVDFDLIRQLTTACRNIDGAGGCVQHGASMLSIEKIGKLPPAGCIEVHLAAAFLNSIYEHLPLYLVQTADDWLRQTRADEWKPEWSEAQFLHHARRYPIGPFKKEWWQVTACHEAIRESTANKASAYFTALNVENTRDLVAEITNPTRSQWRGSLSSASAQHDEAFINDLAD